MASEWVDRHIQADIEDHKLDTAKRLDSKDFASTYLKDTKTRERREWGANVEAMGRKIRGACIATIVSVGLHQQPALACSNSHALAVALGVSAL